MYKRSLKLQSFTRQEFPDIDIIKNPGTIISSRQTFCIVKAPNLPVRWKENCIEFHFQTDGISSVVLRKLLRALKWSWLRGIQNQPSIKVQKEASKAAATAGKLDEDASVHTFTHVDKFLHSSFQMLSCTSTLSKRLIRLFSKQTCFASLTTSTQPPWKTYDFWTANGTTTKKRLMKI